MYELSTPKRTVRQAVATTLGLTALLAGCVTMPTESNVPRSTGAAGGSAAVGADSRLQTCPEAVGTVRLEAGRLPQQRGVEPGSSLDSLRLLIQQSGCLLIVERGVGEADANDEKLRSRSAGAEVRDDANMGPGQEVAADFVLRSLVNVYSNERSRGITGGGILGTVLSGTSFGKSTSSAEVQLLLIDVRSKVQLASAKGLASGEDTKLATNVLTRMTRALGNVQYSDESRTPTGKIVLQAYADAFNQLVPALSGYRMQTVRGGAGAGGTLRVQGAPAPSPR